MKAVLLSEISEFHIQVFALDTKEDSVTTAEISSFQLETIVDFKPDVCAVLNITPDHLDRHGTVEVYAQTKESIGKTRQKTR